jgi:hypothetical protein
MGYHPALYNCIFAHLGIGIHKMRNLSCQPSVLYPGYALCVPGDRADRPDPGRGMVVLVIGTVCSFQAVSLASTKNGLMDLH